MEERGDREALVLLGVGKRDEGLVDRIGFHGLVLFTAGSALSITLAQGSFYGLVFLPWLLASAISRRIAFPKSRIIYAAAFLLAAYVIATAFGINQVVSLKYLKKLGLFFILFLTPLFLASERRLHVLISLLILGMTVNALYGIAEWLVQLERYPGGGTVGGTFGFYVTFGGVLVISSVLTYGRIWLKEPLKHRLAYVCAFALQVFALFLTRERNALVGLVVGVLFFTLYSNWRYVPLVLVLTVAATFILPGPMKRKVSGTSFTEKVVKTRLAMWRGAIQIIGRHPLTGVGPANVKQGFRKELPDFEMPFRHVHNNYLQILLELGIIGFGVFLWMFGEGLRGALRHRFKYRDSDDFLSLTSLSAGAAIAGFLAAGLFEFNFGDSEVTMPIWFLLGVIVAIERGMRITHRPFLARPKRDKSQIRNSKH